MVLVNIGVFQIDYIYLVFGGCFGLGCLVFYGVDLVGDVFNGVNQLRLDNDFVDNCNGYGIYVVGIIVVQLNNFYGIVGVVEGVQLGVYCVFGCQGDVGNDFLIVVYNMVYEVGSDIIIVFIGGVLGWSEDFWVVVVL